MKYKLKLKNSQLNEIQINKRISECNDFNDVLVFLKQNHISIEKIDPPFGELRSEHLIKAINISNFLKNTDLICNLPLLKNTKSLFLNVNQLNDKSCLQ
mgnify:CR=1 FL=1